MSLLAQFSEVSKFYGSQDVLTAIQWQVPSGIRAALVGRNGAGKTTLFRLLTGEEEPDRGVVQVRSGMTIAAMDQDLPTDAGQTLREEAARGLVHIRELEDEFAKVTQELSAVVEDDDSTKLLDRYAFLEERLRSEGAYSAQSRVSAILEGLHFTEDDLDRPLAEFSGGQKSRASLARVLLRDPDLLLLDEPTNHLDLDAIEWLEDFLATYRGSFLLVSHDRVFLNRLSREVIEVRDRKLHFYKGNYDEFLLERERRLEDHIRRYEMQREEIRKHETFIKKNIVRASTTKRAQSRRNKLERMERIAQPEYPQSSIRMRLPEPARTARNVFEAKRLTKGYGGDPVIRNYDFLVLRGQKLALVGPNGVGKSTLLRMLVGESSPDSGVLRVGSGVEVGYFEQEQKALRGEASVLDDLWSVTPTATEGEMRTFLGAFLFRGDAVYKALNQLSGGEKSRVALARIVRRGSNVLVLDEPTNHLDLESRAVMEAALEAYRGTVVTASHDRAFLAQVVDSVLEMRADGCRFWEGGYEHFAASRHARGTDAPPAKTAARGSKKAAAPAKKESGARPASGGPAVTESSAVGAAKVDNAEDKEARKAQYEEGRRRKREEKKLRRRLAQAESAVMDLEGRKEGLLLDMADPAVATDPKRMAELHGELRGVETELASTVSEWERLAVRVEAHLDGSNHLS